MTFQTGSMPWIVWISVFACTKADLTEKDFSIDWLGGWHSQYRQDHKIMSWLYSEEPADAWYSFSAGESTRQGVFVELGAGDGLDKSNSLAFEQKLGWTGLLIEPSSKLYQQLQQNRPNAKCVQACVAGRAGRKDFVEDGLNSGTTSRHMLSNHSTKSLMCESLSSLIDLHLAEHGSHIDYLSLDVEGSELEILRTFNFQKHQVDVISVDIDDILPETMYKRLSRLLRRNGYRFLDRIVADEIWVRQRGFYPDPSCSLRSVMLQTTPPFVPSISWGGVRSMLTQLLKAGGPDQLGPKGLLERNEVEELFTEWSTGDLTSWEEQCPVGMLSLGLAFSLMRDRQNEVPQTNPDLIRELRQQTIFYWNTRLVAMLDTIDFDDIRKQSEMAAEDFRFRLPLGRSWHLSSFEEILESGWPLFGLLALCSKRMAMIPQLFEHLNFDRFEEVRPISMPRIRCQLSVSSQISLDQKAPWDAPGKRKSTQTLLLNSDTCNLLGTAASYFHHIRRELSRLFAEKKEGHRKFTSFDRIANWSASCSEGPPLKPSSCHEKSLHECAALGHDSKAIPAKCMALHQSGGMASGLRLRRKFRFSDNRMSNWLDQGERLFRVFVERHGLYFALWSAGQMELAPLQKKSETGEDRETMFDVLHSIQEQLFLVEGYPVYRAAI
ncbi:Protein Star [Durusdinium trenchii]|uniref:Protein Star n=1 Tax=Durusdinium trenchii TaxID=1381693 RepID=A0ABP0QA74_9DINO